MITTQPNKKGNITIAEGSNVELICRANGTGRLNVQWVRVMGSLPNNAMIESSGRKLVINNITVSDSGQYYCNVSNNEGSVSSMTVQVTARSESLIINSCHV